MGHVEVKLEAFLKEKGVSKNFICDACKLQRTQLNNYCKNKITRVDLTIMAKLCEALNCQIGDLLEYQKEEDGQEMT